MQQFVKTFLALYFAHLLTDFVLQSDRIVAEKKKGKLVGYAKHGGIHLFTGALMLGLANPECIWVLKCYVVLVGLAGIHLLIDRIKIFLLVSNKILDSAWSLVVDQVVHGITVFAAAWLIVGTPRSEFIARLNVFDSHVTKILSVLVVYVGVIFGGGYLVRYATKPLLRGERGASDESTTQLQSAGMYIGWLERFLVLTALMVQSPATIGLILTAKSIARYPEFKSVRFAEYFLIGTLLSMSLGILGGLLLLKVLYGTVLLSR